MPHTLGPHGITVMYIVMPRACMRTQSDVEQCKWWGVLVMCGRPYSVEIDLHIYTHRLTTVSLVNALWIINYSN